MTNLLTSGLWEFWFSSFALAIHLLNPEMPMKHTPEYLVWKLVFQSTYQEIAQIW